MCFSVLIFFSKKTQNKNKKSLYIPFLQFPLGFAMLFPVLVYPLGLWATEMLLFSRFHLPAPAVRPQTCSAALRSGHSFQLYATLGSRSTEYLTCPLSNRASSSGCSYLFHSSRGLASSTSPPRHHHPLATAHSH